MRRRVRLLPAPELAWTSMRVLIRASTSIEIDTLCPELPTFRTEAECVELVTALLSDAERMESIRATCAARLAGHTYAARLQAVTAAVRQAVTA